MQDPLFRNVTCLRKNKRKRKLCDVLRENVNCIHIIYGEENKNAFIPLYIANTTLIKRAARHQFVPLVSTTRPNQELRWPLPSGGTAEFFRTGCSSRLDGPRCRRGVSALDCTCLRRMQVDREKRTESESSFTIRPIGFWEVRPIETPV